MATRSVRKTWYFESSSGKRTYETMQYEDGELSCNCPGWVFKKSAGRGCKHTRLVGVGRADIDCVASHGYTVDTESHTPTRYSTCPHCGCRTCSGECVEQKTVSKTPIRTGRRIQWQH